MATEPSFFSATLEAFIAGKEKTVRERKAKQADYQTKFIQRFGFSPQSFYALVSQNLEERRIPGLRAELVQMREAVAGSAKRLYLKLSRERFVYYLCAAPYGSGFFISWRLVDERRPATLRDFIVAALCLVPLVGVLLLMNFSIGDTSFFICAFVMFILIVMHLAALAEGRVCKQIEESAIIGPIFERLYRPETYYREDSLKMFQKSVELATMETIDGITKEQVTRDNGGISPLVPGVELHRK